MGQCLGNESKDFVQLDNDAGIFVIIAVRGLGALAKRTCVEKARLLS